ncbi:MAG: LamG domain-containing protein, partial [Candidatus Hydrogenedentes bacterium]|nr:LamG domain-containing protein [Candidatus Hydrogenedentota bacterium]
PRCTRCLAIALILVPFGAAIGADAPLIAHWPLTVDGRDASGNGNDATAHGTSFDTKDGALFDGRGAYLEVPHNDALNLGDGDFAISMWVHTEAALDDTLGELVSKFDPVTRKGLNFGLMNYHGVVCAQSNYRNLFFGLDDGAEPAPWKDCGRPGNAIYPMALCVYQDDLYAGTFEMGKNEAGHLYRYLGGDQWEDCGAPFPSNAISALAVHDGELYVAASHYRSRGSSLGDSENDLHGGRVYRFKGKDQWEDCGKLGESEAIYGLVSFKGKLYGSSLYAPAGLFRYDGGTTWTDVGNPGGRVEALGIHNGQLLGAGFDLDYGGAYRFDDPGWTNMGTPPDTTQCYGFMQYQGELFVSSWPTGKVFVLGEPGDWQDRGQLGDEKESMGMAVYNGKLYGGTLPLAQVYRYDGGTTWTNTGRLDMTPDVKYRRAWSMAVFQGKLFCGVLPSGRILSYEAGRAISHDTALPAGWVHLVAQRKSGAMSLYINGKRVGEKKNAGLNLDNTASLKIGFGQHDYFNGRMKDVRIYGSALSESEIAALAKR